MAIVHLPGRLFSQNLVHVYKDGHLIKTAPLRCPSLSEVRQAGFGKALGSWRDLDRVGSGVPVSLPQTSDFSLWGLCSHGGHSEELDTGGTSGFAVT